MEPWTKRTYVRATFAAVLTLLGSLTTALVDGGLEPVEILSALTLSLTAAGTWLGVGTQSNTIEPFYHNEEHVEVPRPPAQPVANPDAG